MRISDWSSDVCSSDLFLGKLLLERSGKSVLQSSAVSAGGLLGLLFALGRLRRKVAVRRLRSAIGGEQAECANVRPFVLRNHIAEFIDLGMLGVQRFILGLETRNQRSEGRRVGNE